MQRSTVAPAREASTRATPRCCEALARVRTVTDLALLPSNDLGSSPLADELRGLGAFRGDVTGAGPVVYGLFTDRAEAVRAAAVLGARATTWIARPG